jgi:hypothetical protein
MKNKDISKVDGDGIDDASMQDIENSINSGGSGIEPPKKKKGKGALVGIILIMIAIGLFIASGFLSPGINIQNIVPDAVSAENEGKLVHITGSITESEFTDPMFKVNSKGVSLERVVEMYQWVEENGLYSKRWESKLIDISSEDAKAKGIINPAEMPFFSDKWQTEDLKIGAFSLSPNLSKQIGDLQDITLTQEDFEKLDNEGKQAFKLQNGVYFFGLDIDKPRIGDLKIHFKKLESSTLSILAQQKGASLVAFTTDSGVIEKSLPGSHSAEDMKSGTNLGSEPYLTWAAQGLSVFFGLFGIIKILKAPRSPKKPKEPKIKKEKAINKKAAIEEVAPAVAAVYQPEESTQEEQSVFTEKLAPVEDNFADNMNDSPIETENHESYHPEITAPTPEEPIAYSEPEAAPEMPPPSFDFANNSEEMPAGIEIIGPDSMSEEPAEESPQIIAEAPIAEPEMSFDDSEEFPAGIEMIGPDTSSPSSFEIPPPEPDEMESLSFEPSENAVEESSFGTVGLDYMPTFTPPHEEEEEELQSPEYSAYELAEPPPSFPTENESPDDLEDLDEIFNPADIPPPPLDFDSETIVDDTAGTPFDPNYLSTDFELPEELDEAPIPEEDEDFNEDDDEDNDYDEELDEPDESTAFPAVPPLPFPEILMGRKMTFDDNIAEAMAPSPTPTLDDLNTQAEEHHDVFTDLLNNIPDDFDPNAEMTSPQQTDQPSDGTEEFDPFADPEDDNFSPYATAKD